MRRGDLGVCGVEGLVRGVVMWGIFCRGFCIGFMRRNFFSFWGEGFF